MKQTLREKLRWEREGWKWLRSKHGRLKSLWFWLWMGKRYFS